MITVELSNEEAIVLVETLERFLSDLRMEISHTDRQEFRDGLKHRKEALMGVVQKLSPPSN